MEGKLEEQSNNKNNYTEGERSLDESDEDFDESDEDPYEAVAKQKPNKKNNYLRDELPMHNIVWYMLIEDDAESFVDEVRSIGSLVAGTDFDITSLTMDGFFSYDSVKCAAAVLNGETSPFLDYNGAFCRKAGQPPLHNAAFRKSDKLIKLFLEHNPADANHRCDCEPFGMEGMHLPLHVALEEIRRREGIFDWDWERDRDTKNPVFKLVFRLCSLNGRCGLEGVRLLAEKTDEIGKEIYYYVKEGKLVELAVLLLVAREIVMTTPLPLENNVSGKATLRAFILAEIASLSVLDSRSSYARNKKMVRQQKNTKTKLEQVLLLLEIFERIGEQLFEYWQQKKNDNFEQLAEEIFWRFKEGGFDVRRELFEDIERYFSNAILCLKIWRTFFNFTSKTYKYFPTKKSYQQASLAARRSLIERSSPTSELYRSYVPQLRSYHALPNAKDCMESDPVTCAESFDGRVVDVKKQVEDLIMRDNKAEFVACIQTQLERESCGMSEVKLCPSEILKLICSHCALDCATALLEGETGLVVDLNVAFKNGLYPIHYAAQNLSPSLTRLLLHHGAKTDLCCCGGLSKYGGMLPLSLALETICKMEFLLDWAPSKSFFKLIYVLCLPELIEPLEAIRLLALNTEELPLISSRIAREGRLPELAVLLVVARETLIAKASGEVPVIEQCMLEELQLIIDKEFKLMGRSQYSNAIRMCKHKKKLLLSAAVMLDVFDLAGDLIEQCRLGKRFKEISRYRLAVEVATCIKVRGFDLKKKDVHPYDMSCFLPELGSKQAEKLRMESQPNQSKSHFSLPAVSQSQSRAFHTDLWSKMRMDDKRSAAVTSYAIGTTQLAKPSFEKLSGAKELVSFASTLKRRIRSV